MLRFLRRVYPGVNTRIIFPFLVAIVIVAGIGVFTVTQLVAGSVQERLQNQLLASADAATNSIVDIEREQLSVLRLMVFTEGIDTAIVERNTETLDLRLRPIAANAVLDDFVVFDDQGRGILQLRRGINLEYVSLTPADFSQMEIIQRIVTGETDPLGDKFIQGYDDPQGTIFYIGGGVTNAENTLVGGVLVGIRAETLVRRVSEQSLSSVTLLRNDTILSSTYRVPQEQLVVLMENLGDLDLTLNANASPIRSLTLGEEPYQVLYAPFLLRSQRVGLLAVGLPSNFITENTSTSRNLFGLLFMGLFIAVGVIGLLVARTITSPITRLVSVTRAIREGDLSKRVALRTPDELGELALSFDRMTDDLVQRNEEINTLYVRQLEITSQREAVLRSISDAVLVQDTTGRLILSNPTAEVLIQTVSRHPAQRSEFAQLCRYPAALAEPRTVSFADHYFSVLATPVVADDGSLMGYVIVFRDITPLIEADRVKDELMLQLSHELRTPLSSIRGYVELVKMMYSSRLDAKATDFLQKSLDSTSTLERLLNQSLDVSAMISDRFNLVIEPFNLSHLLNDLYLKWKPQMQARSLSLTLGLTQTIWMNGDQVRVAQMVEQVLQNAHDYTLPGGMIEIDVANEDDNAIISVIDSGVGIAPEELDRVFERLYRGRSANAGPTDSRGLGLGLYIARYIAEAHGGAIWIESKFELGTIVTMRLPLHQREVVV